MTALLLAGATGLVGSALLSSALEDGRIGRVVAPTRRALPPHPRLVNPVFEDFEAIDANAEWWAVDAVACALGTTIRQAGSRTAFERVDYHYPLELARNALRSGATAFVLASAAGADPASPLFYSRTKGALERALAATGFPSLTLVRPGLLGGERERRRWAEHVAVKVLTAGERLLPRRYRVVPAAAVARSMLAAAMERRPGTHIIESGLLLDG